MTTIKKNNQNRKKHQYILTFLLSLLLCWPVEASQIHFKKLEEVIGEATVIIVARIESVVYPYKDNQYRYLYRITKIETLAGNIESESIDVIFGWPPSQRGEVRISPLIPASGLEFNFAKGEEYILLFRDVNPFSDGTVSLLRAEEVENLEKVMALWNQVQNSRQGLDN